MWAARFMLIAAAWKTFVKSMYGWSLVVPMKIFLEALDGFLKSAKVVFCPDDILTAAAAEEWSAHCAGIDSCCCWLLLH